MKTVQLKRIESVPPSIDFVDGEKTYKAIEFEAGPGKRFLISVDIDELPPKMANDIMNQVRDAFRKVLPPESFLLTPARNGHPLVAIYEMTEVE
jgi:hypothetical protein